MVKRLNRSAVVVVWEVVAVLAVVVVKGGILTVVGEEILCKRVKENNK